MKVLVTGGAGFIGSNIVDALIQEGHEVAIIDDLSSGKTENLNPAAKFYKLDICSAIVFDVFSKFKPDVVIHHAAQINLRKSIEDPDFDYRINVGGTQHLVKAAEHIGVKKFIFASSGGAVYGEPKYIPVDENHIMEPTSPYGENKMKGEQVLKNSSLDYVCLRYSNVYGPRQDPHGEAGVISIFTGKILRGEEIKIFGDGNQKRDYVFVEDVVKANLAAIEYTGQQRSINIGTGVETSVNDLVEKIKNILNLEVTSTHTPPIEGEIERIALNIELAKNNLGWIPKTDIDTGLEQTVLWFQSQQ